MNELFSSEITNKNVGSIMDKILKRRYPEKVTENTISFDDLLTWDMWESFLIKGSHITLP